MPYIIGMRRRASTILLVLLAAMAVVSVLTMPRRTVHSGGPLLAGAQIDPQVLAIIGRSCHDCHSDSTTYPWYSYVAPVSLLITSDVSGGRAKLNFSHWNEYPLVRRMRLLTEMANQVKDREMPMSIYIWLHRDARLSDAEIGAIFQWTQAERARLIASGER